MRAHGRALPLAFLAILVLPAVVLAHPLGNFTINHYAGLRIEPDRVTLDLVIDQAEIPAFQARQALDANEDGEVSDAEARRGSLPSCDALADDLHLAMDGSPMDADADGRGHRAPAGRRRPVDAPPGVRLRGSPHEAGCIGHARRVRRHLVRGATRLARDRRRRFGRGGHAGRGRAARQQHLGPAPGIPGGSARQRPRRRARGRRRVSGRGGCSHRSPSPTRRRSMRSPPIQPPSRTRGPRPPFRAASVARFRPSSRHPT